MNWERSNIFYLIVRDDTVTSILVSILVPNIIFVISVAILVYWFVNCMPAFYFKNNYVAGIVHTVKRDVKNIH